ncbi:MAG: DUF1439 domain-containing protein [Xanthomonadaceae bacterium]|nr:DUF1439 domain-containing protein [Xanthomonadaceae bacterium]
MIARRRTLLRAALLLASSAALASCATLETAQALLGNQASLSPAQLQKYLDKHYPRDYEQLGGLVTLTVLNPRVAIPPESTRLHLDFDVGLEGLGMRSDRPAGHFALTSGLRYDTRTNALYMEEPELESAELPLLGGRMNATGRDLINGWLRDYARSEPVYRLEPDLQQKLGDRRIAGTLIRNGRVVIELDR